MVDVDFPEEDNNWMPIRNEDKQKKGLVGLLFRFGLAKNQKQANYILFGVAIIFVVIALIVILRI